MNSKTNTLRSKIETTIQVGLSTGKLIASERDLKLALNALNSVTSDFQLRKLATLGPNLLLEEGLRLHYAGCW